MRRLVLVVLTVAVTVGLAGAPASAQTKVRKDKVGDAAANIDVRSVKVQNTAQRFAVTVRFTRVQKRRTGVVVLVQTPDFAEGVTIVSIPVGGGRYSARLYDVGDDFDGFATRLNCPGLTATWKSGRRGFGRVVVPQSCLGAVAGTTETTVVAADKRLTGDPAASRRVMRGDGDVDGYDPLDSFVRTRRG